MACGNHEEAEAVRSSAGGMLPSSGPKTYNGFSGCSKEWRCSEFARTSTATGVTPSGN